LRQTFHILKPSHFIAIGVAVALVAALYFGGNTTPPPPKPETAQVPHAAQSPMAGAMPGAVLPEPANFDSLKEAAIKKLSPQLVAKLNDKEAAIAAGSNTAKIAALEDLGALWQSYKHPSIAAHYYAQAGKLENSEKKLTFAAHLFFEELKHEQNPNKKQWLANGAIECFTQALTINPDNDEARLDLASIYIDGTGEVMKGVTELRTLTARDSTHLAANTILGRMAIESGQYDKAIARGEIILRHHKNNWQACILMAEAYKRSGQIDKAKEMLMKAKSMNADPEFQKDVTEYMNTL
jgi:tetratricopeptide (TPR) repeat protein